MYLQATKTMLATAMKNTFDGDYVNALFRNINIGIEYPEDKQDYPGIWVDFEPIGEMEVAGVGHTEYALSPGGGATPFTRWRFQGYATFTIVALTSRERDGLFDEVVRVFGFGGQHPSTKPFRQTIEDNPLIAINMDFGTIGQRGFAASPGTPWNTDEIIYECTVAMNLIGEFVADNIAGVLAPIEEIQVTEIAMHESDPDPTW